MPERIELEISTAGMKAGAEDAKRLLESIPKAAGKAARDADAEMQKAIKSAQRLVEAQSKASASLQQQTTAYQQQAAIQKQVLAGTISLAQGEQKLAQARQQATAATAAEKTGNAALAAQYAKSRAEVTANAAAIKAAQQAQVEAGRQAVAAQKAQAQAQREAQALAKQTAAEEQRLAAIRTKAAQEVQRQATAEAAARQKQATALNNTRVAAVAQNTTLQKQIAIQKQVLAGTLSLTQGEEQLAAVTINLKVKNDALSASLAKSKTEYAANAAAIRAMKAPAEESASGFSKFASAAALVKGALVGGVVLAAANQLKTMTVNAIDAADAIDDLASQLNISAEALQELQFAFEQGGSSAEAFTSGFQTLQKNVGDAAAGIGKARQVFKALGIDAKQFAADLAADPTKALANFADKIQAIQNPAQQTAVVMRLLGDPSWVNILKQGGDRMEENIEILRKLGLVSNETAAAGGELKNEMNELSRVVSAQLTTALVNLGPTLLDVGRWLLDLSGKIGGVIDGIFRLSSATKQARVAELTIAVAKTRQELTAAEAATQNVGEAATAAMVGVAQLAGKLSDEEKELAHLNGQLVTMNVQHGSSTTATKEHTGALLNMEKATKAAKTETEKAGDALQKNRAAMMADTEILRKQADILQDVIDGKLSMGEATAKMAAIEKGATVDSKGLTAAFEAQTKRVADNKAIIDERNKAAEELIKRTSELKKAIDETTNSLEEEARIQQVGLTTMQASVAAGKTLEEAHKDAARAIELTTLWLQEYNDKMDKGMDEAGARQFANEMVALKEKTLDLADAAEKFGEDYEKALKNAILTTGDLKDEFETMLDTLLDGGNIMDDIEDFGKDMGKKLIMGIGFGKSDLENQVLIPNFQQLFGQNGTVSGIFSSGGQSAGSSFVSGFMHWIAGDPNFSNVTSGGSSTAGIFNNVTSGSSTAGLASGKAFGGGFKTGLDSFFGGPGGFGQMLGGTGIGMAAGAPIGDWASKKLGVGQTKQGKMGGMIGGAVGGIGGGIGGAVLLGATIGSIIPGFGTLIGAAIGAALGIIGGMIGGGVLGDLFAPGRIQQEKMGMTKYFEKVFEGLNFKEMSEKAVAKGLVDYDEVRNAGETLGVIFADSMGKGATQGTMIRFPGQLFANFRKMGLSVEEAKEKVLELAKAMGVDFASSIETVNMAMNKAASGPTLLGLGITQEEIKEARKNLKEYGDTSHMTIAELDKLALANGNVGSTIITLNQLYAGAVDLQTGFSDHAAAVAGVNGLLADKFTDVATAGGMAEETITDLSEKVRNGTLSVEEALIAYNKWADSAGKARLALDDVALDAEAFDPLTGSIAEANTTLEELLTRLQEIDAMLIALAERKIEIKVSLAQDLETIGAISPEEELGGRKAMAWSNLERSRGATVHERVGTDPTTGIRHGGGPTDEERMRLANDLRDYRKILVEEYGLKKAAIEKDRQDRLTAIDEQEKGDIKNIQERYGKQREQLQKELEAAQQQGQAEIDAAKAQGDALVEAARAQGQAEIDAARKQGQAEVEAARKQGQEEVEAARAAGDAIIEAEEKRADVAMAALEKEREAIEEASNLRQEALNAEIDLLSKWRDLATALGEQIHALITAAESPLSGPEQFGAIQRETERARQRLEGTSGAERIPAIQDLARLLGEQLSSSPYQRLDPRQRELFSRLTQELTKLQQEAGREGAPLEDKQAQLLLLQAQSTDALKSIDARIEAARVEAEAARERAEAQAAALVAAAEAAAEARNAAAEANAERRNEAAELHAQAIADAAEKQAAELLAAAEATAEARNKEMQAKMDALSEAEKQEIALVQTKATAERALVNSEADRRQAELLTEYTNLIKDVAKEETDTIIGLEGKAQEDRAIIVGKIREIATSTDTIATNTEGQSEVLGRLADALTALNTFLAGVTKAQGGMYDPQLKSNRLILAHRGETVAIGQPTRAPQAAAGPSVTIGAITINGASTMTKADVKAAVEEAVVQSVRPNGQGRAELKRQGVKFQ